MTGHKPMFDGFDLRTVRAGGTEFRLRTGGAGPPLLLLHGHPQTHVMWHLVAPRLAESFAVVAADLPGYGRSRVPGGAGIETHSKRAMAASLVDLMAALGHERFAVVGHDRGARVGYRMALDHPDRVERLALLDIVPTAELWRRMDSEVANDFWHWLFLARPAPLPERLLAADPDAYYFATTRHLFDPEALADYLEACRDPAVIHTMCQDYRAGAGVDRQVDEADLAAGRRIGCPVLVMWGSKGRVPRLDPLVTWRRWADDVRGASIPTDHYLAEEAPDLVLDQLVPFLTEAAGAARTP